MKERDNRNQITDTMQEKGDYIGADGLLYCGECNTRKEAYFPEGKIMFGRDRHPSRCDCQKAQREKQEARERRRVHEYKVEHLKSVGFTDRSMRGWTFEADHGRNPQMKLAHLYVEFWEEMKAGNRGYLLWGGVGTGKSYFAGCIANALIEQEISVRMTNFATILNDLSGSSTGRNGYIEHLCSYSPAYP